MVGRDSGPTCKTKQRELVGTLWGSHCQMSDILLDCGYRIAMTWLQG